MSLNRRTFVIGSAAAVGAGALAGSALADAAQNPERTYTDPVYNKPYVDVDEWRDKPTRHRYVHGGFTGTDAKFLVLFPPKEQWQGRFFQHNTAIPTSELLAGNIFGGDFAGFCFDSGAAALVTNQGGFNTIPQADLNGLTGDPAIGSYRVAAAAAMHVRTLAQQMYGPHRTYGYAFGGSGGGYRTISCAENTNAWDGVVPYIHGNAQAWPNSYSGRSRAQRVLKSKFPQIADAIEPGGSGDIYAGLNDLERNVLLEATRLGFPMRAWVFQEAMGVGPLAVMWQGIQTMDPSYFEDFWKKPGHLGFDSPQTFQGVRVQHRTKVSRVIKSNEAAAAGVPPGGARGGAADPETAWRAFEADYGAPLPVALQLETPPPAGYLDMANIDVASGPGAGKWLILGGMVGNIAKLQFAPNGGSLRDVTDHIRVGDEVVIDNSNILAWETLYRHSLLPADYYPGNSFRRPDGTPMYPQRPRITNYDLMKGATAGIPNGKFNCKMIVVQNLLDWDAHPWYADWYRTKVKEHLGARFGDNYRLYYTDYATHGAMPDPTRVISYNGALQQALRDVAAWSERGVAPPAETSYEIKDSQVIVPATAAKRKGMQAVVTLQANGGARAAAKVGQPVTFTALIETPPQAGSVVAAEWDFDATPAVVPGNANRFPMTEEFKPAPRVTLTRQHTFTKPGTYFPALRVHSQRQGNATTPYARIPNLGRVRVVVT